MKEISKQFLSQKECWDNITSSLNVEEMRHLTMVCKTLRNHILISDKYVRLLKNFKDEYATILRAQNFFLSVEKVPSSCQYKFIITSSSVKASVGKAFTIYLLNENDQALNIFSCSSISLSYYRESPFILLLSYDANVSIHYIVNAYKGNFTTPIITFPPSSYIVYYNSPSAKNQLGL